MSSSRRLTCCGFLLLLLACFLRGDRIDDLKSSPSNWMLSSISGNHKGIPASKNVTKVAEVPKRITERSVQGFASARKLVGKRASRGQCNQTCTYQRNITCQVTKRSTMCIHRDESATDFPNRPRDLEIHRVPVNDKIMFNITWKAPYDFSYKAVTGYELHVSRFDFYTSHPKSVDCYFVNLSTTDWSEVRNVHDVVYFLDCVQMWSASFRKLHVTIFSYPKVAGKHQEKSIEAWSLADSERVKPKNPSLSWDPNITTFQDMDNESLIVNVQPAVRPIHYLQVCITKASSIPCQGNIFRMESAKNMFRYGVMDLEGNQSYYVYVRPFDENDDALDVWIHKQEPIFLKPWPEELVPPQPPPQRATLGVVVGLVVIILLLLMAVIITCVMWRRGCLQKIWFRFPQTAFGGRPIRVVQLYEKESEQFRRLVKTHMQYLSQYINLDVRDCEALGDQFHVDHWLEQSCTLLVYMSPQLRNQLRMLDPEMHYSSSHLMTRKVSLIYRMIAASDRQKGRSRRARVIFILPRCWSCSDDMEEYLNQHETLGRLPCFYISSPPGALLNKLSGCHQSLLSACRSSSARSQELSNTINTLLQMIRVGQDQYLAGAQLNGHANLQMMCGAYDYELDHNAHSTVMPPCIRATGHPHRTDSGFSSSTDHHHGGSNPSSEHNSPGEQYEEEGTETDPMMQSQANCLPYSASEMSLSFVPPESVVGDVDSIIMDDRCRRLNDQGDW